MASDPQARRSEGGRSYGLQCYQGSDRRIILKQTKDDQIHRDTDSGDRAMQMLPKSSAAVWEEGESTFPEYQKVRCVPSSELVT